MWDVSLYVLILWIQWGIQLWIIWNGDRVFSKVKEISVLRLLGRVLFEDFSRRRNSDSTKGTRWWELKEVHLTKTAVWNRWSGQIYGFTLSDGVMIGWRLCRFTVRMVIWQVLTSESNSIHESFKSRVNVYKMLKCDFYF